MGFPLWATPQRRMRLVELFTLWEKGLCPYSVQPCRWRLEDCFLLAWQEVVDYWKEEDREVRSLEWKREKRQLHAAPHRHLPKVRTREWDSIVQENYLSQRPVFRLVGIGVDAFSFRRVAEVELPGLRLTTWVDISGVKLSKNKLRKAIRYGKGDGAPPELHDRIAQQVRRYLRG